MVLLLYPSRAPEQFFTPFGLLHLHPDLGACFFIIQLCVKVLQVSGISLILSYMTLGIMEIYFLGSCFKSWNLPMSKLV